jgi:hypothetical protein
VAAGTAAAVIGIEFYARFCDHAPGYERRRAVQMAAPAATL